MAEHAHHSHGNTVAAWACVGLLMVAALHHVPGRRAGPVPLFVIGGVVAVIGCRAASCCPSPATAPVAPSDPRVTSGVR